MYTLYYDMSLTPVIAPPSIRQDSAPLSWKLALDVCTNPLTWLPALAYMSSFGYELAIDANLANVYFGMYNKTKGFGQTRSGYVSPSRWTFIAQMIYMKPNSSLQASSAC